MKFAKNNITSITAENLRLRQGHLSHFIGISQYKLSGLEWDLVRIAARDSATFDCRLGNAIPKAKGFSLAGSDMAILSPDRLDTRNLMISFSRPFDRGFKACAVGS